MSLKAGTTKVSLHLYLNNPGGLVQAAVYEDGSGIRRKKKPLPNIPNNNAHGGDDSKSVNMRQALGFCWSVSLTPGGKMAEKKVASLELNKRLKDLPCLSDVSSTIDTPDLQFAKTDPIEQTEEADENKGQRKVSEKLAEWLDEYNLVSRKQQIYLRKIHDLRHSLLHQDDKKFMQHVDRIQHNPNHKKASRRYPVYTLTKMQEKAVNLGPEPFPNRPCLLYDRTKSPKLLMGPNVGPRKLAPIVKRVKVDKYDKQNETDDVNKAKTDLKPINGHDKADIPPRPEMHSMRTEYEPFESIARRNKLNLNPLLNTSHSLRMTNRRLPVQMSTVTIIDEVPEGNRTTPSDFNQKMNTRKNNTPTRLIQPSPANKQISPTSFVTGYSGKQILVE